MITFRYQGDSQRIVVDRSHSYSPEAGHSSDNRLKDAKHSSGHDKERPAAATSQAFSTRKRSVDKVWDRQEVSLSLCIHVSIYIYLSMFLYPCNDDMQWSLII